MFKYLINHKNGNLILIYHSSFKYKDKNIDTYIHNVTPENILAQINFLSNYYDVVPIDNIFESKYEKNFMSITFDDGYENLFEDILPKLQDKKIPSTVFLIGNSFNKIIFWREKITYLLKNRKLFEKFKSKYYKKFKSDIVYETFFQDSKSYKFNSKILDEHLEEFFLDEHINCNSNLLSSTNKLINSKYINYGNHTFNHYVLSTLSDEQQYEEIKKNQLLLNSLNVNLSHVFALPFGTYTDFNDKTLSILKELKINNVLLNNNIINGNLVNKLNKTDINYLDRLTTSNNRYLFTYKMIKSLLNI